MAETSITAIDDILTREHPRWREFCDRLAGPDGVRFEEGPDGRDRWRCDSSHERPFARAILADFGVDVEATLAYFEAFGGYCDCEILFNVDRDEGEDDEPEPELTEKQREVREAIKGVNDTFARAALIPLTDAEGLLVRVEREYLGVLTREQRVALHMAVFYAKRALGLIRAGLEGASDADR